MATAIVTYLIDAIGTQIFYNHVTFCITTIISIDSHVHKIMLTSKRFVMLAEFRTLASDLMLAIFG